MYCLLQAVRRGVPKFDQKIILLGVLLGKTSSMTFLDDTCDFKLYYMFFTG